MKIDYTPLHKDTALYVRDFQYIGLLKDDVDDICRNFNMDIETGMIKVHMIIEPFEFPNHKENTNADI